MEIRMIKCHGSDNDFLIIDEITNDFTFSEEERSKLAVVLCNRNTGLGADGVLYVMNSVEADGRMRVFNADGSEASMCGNGLRCVARYICELTGRTTAVIETMKATLTVEQVDDIFPHIPTYLVEISPVYFETNKLPANLGSDTLLNERIPTLSNELLFTAVAVPNPHLISIVDKEQLAGNTQQTISEYVNRPNELFPDGVNVSFVKPIKKGRIFVRTYERGVGFTNACGTAMSASTLITCLQDLNEFELPVEVYNNGGMVRCVSHRKDGSFYIDLIGNATYVYNTIVVIDLEHPELFKQGAIVEYSNEIQQYAIFKEEIIRFLENKMM